MAKPGRPRKNPTGDPKDTTSSSGSRVGAKRGRPKKGTLQSALATIQIDEKDIIKWMQLVELRGSKNELFRMADRFQANLIITGVLTIQEIYKSVAAGVSGEDASIDSLTKLTTSFNRAVASINQALSYLGVTGNKRPDEPDNDALAEFLKTASLQAETLPELQMEFLAARADMARMGHGGDPREDNDGGVASPMSEINQHNRSVLATLKKPMKSYQETENEMGGGSKEKIVDAELERSKTL